MCQLLVVLWKIFWSEHLQPWVGVKCSVPQIVQTTAHWRHQEIEIDAPSTVLRSCTTHVA